ncbi:MAG: hypothetical protein PQJ50_04700, partial [Spirochaetales bacterium]|nr:hypothetical protein [Spirochaetales bacterium]
MKIKKLLASAVFAAFSLIQLSAETQDLPFVRGMAESMDYKHKQIALSEIDTLISEGSLSESRMRGVIDVLNYLACEGIVNLRYESLRVENDNIMIRNEAVRLLGLTGHPDAVDSLMTVLQNETSTVVLSTA